MAKVPKRAKAAGRRLVAREPVKEPVKKASLIGAEVMVSFGAGYAVQAERESPLKGELPDPCNLPKNPPPIAPPVIFGDAAILQRFQLLLLAGCIKNRKDLPWKQDKLRTVVLKMAFLHGMYARLLVTKKGEKGITADVLKRSLDIVQTWCSGGGGGGPACPFKL